MNTESTLADWLPSFMQTADPLFPNGAYAHSLGLEELVNLGQVKDTTALIAFIREQALPALAHQDLPYLRLACEAANTSDIPLLIELDNEICAWKLPQEIRAASTSQGSHRLRMLLKLWKDDSLNAFSDAFAAERTPGNQIAVLALQYALLKTPLEAGLIAYTYQSIANYCSASIKLIRIGPEACQNVLTQCLEDLNQTIETSLTIEREDAGWFAPTLDIAASRHATAFSRLFIS